MSTTADFISKLHIIPDHITFKDFNCNARNVRRVKVFNHDTTTHHIQVQLEPSKELSVTVIGNQKIIPGLHVTLEISFVPGKSYQTTKTDRRYEIDVICPRLKLKMGIPVIALSPFPTISFPKLLQMPNTGPNVPCFATFLVINFGRLSHGFYPQHPDSVKFIRPSKTTTLKPTQMERFVIEFTPKAETRAEEEIVFHLENAKRFAIPIVCKVISCEVLIENNRLDFPDTYLGATSVRTTNIINNSKHKIKFRFTPATQPSSEPYQSKYFELLPCEGEINPKSSYHIMVIFHPPASALTDFSAEIESEIDLTLNPMAENAHRLYLRGRVLGPKIEMLCKEVDIGLLFSGESRQFELRCKNFGVIGGSVTMSGLNCSFFGVVRVQPDVIRLDPSETATFDVCYTNESVGKFLETIYFQVACGDRIEVAIFGEVKPLIIRVQPELLNFGQIPICVKQTQYLFLKNILKCPLRVEIEIPNNGTSEPLVLHENAVQSVVPTPNPSELDPSSPDSLSQTSGQESPEKSLQAVFNQVERAVDQWLDQNDVIDIIVDRLFDSFFSPGSLKMIQDAPMDLQAWKLPSNAKEVHVTPDNFMLKPREGISLLVTLTPHQYGVHNRQIHVKTYYYDEVNGELKNCSAMAIVTMRYHCDAPEVTCDRAEIVTQTFIGLECFVEANFVNSTDLDGFLTAEELSDNEVHVVPSHQQFRVSARDQTSVQLRITPRTVGEIVKTYSLTFLGGEKTLPLTINCLSKAPEILIKSLMSPEIGVLQPYESRISLKNKSPIPTRYKIEIDSEYRKFYDLNQMEGTLCPKEEVQVVVGACFTDPNNYRATMMFHFDNAQTIKIPLETQAKGLPLQISPQLPSQINLGPIFMHTEVPSVRFSIQNLGNLSYTVHGSTSNEKVLKMFPNQIILAPNESHNVEVMLLIRKPQKVDEEFGLEASLGNTFEPEASKCFFMASIKANFIEPDLKWNKENVVFDIKYGDDYEKMCHEILILRNRCPLLTSVECIAEGDYYLVDLEDCQSDKRMTFELGPLEDREIAIYFNSEKIQYGGGSTHFLGKVQVSVLGKPIATVNAVAVITYPALEVDRECLEIVQNRNSCVFRFEVRNSTILDANYRWRFSEEEFFYENLESSKDEGVRTVLDSIKKSKVSLRSEFVKSFEESDSELVFSEDEEPSLVEETMSKKGKSKKKKKTSAETVPEDTKSIKSDKSKSGKKKKKQGSVPEVPIERKVKPEEIRREVKRVLTTLEKIFGLKTRQDTLESQTTSIQQSKFIFDAPSGVLKGLDSKTISIYLPPYEKGFRKQGFFHLDVEGGKSLDLVVRSTNSESKIKISDTDFDLGYRPWYEIQKSPVTITNNSYIPLIVGWIRPSNANPALDGISCSKKGDTIILSKPFKSTPLKISTYLGPNEAYETILGLEVNGSSPVLLTLRGSGIIPIAFLTNCELDPHNLASDLEYHGLQSYYEKTVKDMESIELISSVPVLVDDRSPEKSVEPSLETAGSQASSEEKRKKKKKRKSSKSRKTSEVQEIANNVATNTELNAEDKEDTVSSFIEVLSETVELLMENQSLEPDSILIRSMSYNVVEEPQSSIEGSQESELDEGSFEFIDYPDSFPNALEVQIFLERFKFLESLKHSQEIRTNFERFADRFCLAKFEVDSKASKKPKPKPQNFKIEPIPLFFMPAYLLTLEDIHLKKETQKTLKLHFSGPGHLNAAIWSEFPIPGLKISFKPPSIGKFFCFEYTLEPPKTGQRYRNRLLRSQGDPAPFSREQSRERKVRKLTNEDRKALHRRYTNVKSSTACDPKQPNLYAEIYEPSLERPNEGGVELEIGLKFCPLSIDFQVGVEIDEVLLIDIHMGPTIPVFLQGIVRK